MVEDGWVKSLDIVVSFPRRGMLAFTITALRPAGEAVAFTHQIPWGA
jgi:hypothetical protein